MHSPVPPAPPSTPCNVVDGAAMNAAAMQALRSGLDPAWKCMEAEDEDSSPVNGGATTHSMDLAMSVVSLKRSEMSFPQAKPVSTPPPTPLPPPVAKAEDVQGHDLPEQTVPEIATLEALTSAPAQCVSTSGDEVNGMVSALTSFNTPINMCKSAVPDVSCSATPLCVSQFTTTRSVDLDMSGVGNTSETINTQMEAQTSPPPSVFTPPPRIIKEEESLQESLFLPSRVNTEIERKGQPPSVSTPLTLLNGIGGAQAPPGGDALKEAQRQDLPFLLFGGAERERKGQSLSVSTPLPTHLHKARGAQTSLRGEVRMEAQAPSPMLTPTRLNEAEATAQTNTKTPLPSMSTALPGLNDEAGGTRTLLHALRASERGSKTETGPSLVLPAPPRTPVDESDSRSVPFAEVMEDIRRRLRDEYNPHDLELFPMNNRRVAVIIASDKFEGMHRIDRQDSVRQFLADDLRTGRLNGVNCSLKTLSEHVSK